MNLTHDLLILTGSGAVSGGVLWASWAFGRWRRRPWMTRFQREILEARMTADDELEYDRIMRALGIGWDKPPQVDSLALYDEVERRYLSKEIGLEQYRSEISELERTYGPTYREGRAR